MTANRYIYYPGCSLKTSAKEYDVSTQMVCEAIGIELVELEGWACCGASSAHNIDKDLGIVLPAREVLKAGKQDMSTVTGCALCFSRLKLAAHELKSDSGRERISRILGEEIPAADYEVLHVTQILKSHQDSISVKKPLNGLKTASYYGCLLVRPKEVMKFDDVENPKIMDDILSGIGAQSVDWAFKTECCGGSHMMTRPDIVMRLTHRLLAQAKQAGADCIVVACPACHSNLDTTQKKIRDEYGDGLSIPIIYITQLIGLAMGIDPIKLHLNKHFVDPLPLLRARELIV